MEQGVFLLQENYYNELPYREMAAVIRLCAQVDSIAQVMVDDDFDFNQFEEVFEILINEPRRTREQRRVLEKICLGHRLNEEDLEHVHTT